MSAIERDDDREGVAPRWPTTTRHPTPADLGGYVDKYFSRTKSCVEHFGDKRVTYAVFMRRPVTCAPRLAIEWLRYMAAERGTEIEVQLLHKEGAWVGAGEPILYISGSLYHLVDLETLYLQKLGAACVAAYNAYTMCVELPGTAFLAMDARHCAGTEMAEIMAYGASVGSAKAQKKVGAKGFTGNASDATAHYFGQTRGFGTMPHALVGYAGSTVRAAEMFHETHPSETLTVLVDYFGQEITDSLAVCHRFSDLAAEGRLNVRLDTHGGRYVEGLDTPEAYRMLERNAPEAIRGYRSETELRSLIGTGVSAAAIWHTRERLNEAGFPNVKIVASSGFGPQKCRVMALAKAPVDIIGTGSYLPDKWSETYATADIIDYDGAAGVKVGREFLLRKEE
ncbi:MAG: nicotinate phosphoribosyltransferase [Alphaproteobacteria bacterium]|nr:nicotinate phosphoribosyltransferase [Alphaproteobacteria bacterium]